MPEVVMNAHALFEVVRVPRADSRHPPLLTPTVNAGTLMILSSNHLPYPISPK